MSGGATSSRRSSTRAATASTASSTSRASRRAASISKARAASCSIANGASRTRAGRRARTSQRSRSSRAQLQLRRRAVSRPSMAPAARSITPTSCSRSARASRPFARALSPIAPSATASCNGSRNRDERIIDLRAEELASFAGNLLELRGAAGPVIALSAAALRSLAAPTRRALERHGELVTADVATIEHLGGGSVRCMLAEVALPPAPQCGGGAWRKIPPQIS